MKIAIAGASGLVGSALIPILQSDGNQITRLVRSSPPQPPEFMAIAMMKLSMSRVSQAEDSWQESVANGRRQLSLRVKQACASSIFASDQSWHGTAACFQSC